MELDHYYLSASEYAKRVGLGELEVKKQVIEGKIEGFITEGGHYKVKVYNNGIDKKQFELVSNDNVRLHTILNNVKKIIMEGD